MNLIQKLSISVVIASMLLCVNAFAKGAPTVDANIVNTPDVNVANTPDVNVANMPDVNVANTPDINVVNGEDAPIPVTVQQNTRQIVVANRQLFTEDEVYEFTWRSANGDSFKTIPDGHTLFITDIVVAMYAFGVAGDPFEFSLWNGVGSHTFSRWLDFHGWTLPFSHSYTTPLAVLGVDDATVAGSSVGALHVSMTGYLINGN